MTTRRPGLARICAWSAASVFIVVGAAACSTTVEPPPAAGPAPSATNAAPSDVPGLVIFDSRHDVPETVRRLSDALAAAGGMVAATVDHTANARSVGEQLRPTTLVLGGVPKAGTPLMAARQEAGVNLPQKYLVWQDEPGKVRLAYNAGDYLTRISDADPAAGAAISEGSARLASTATGSERPSSTGPAPTGRGELTALRSDADPATTLQRLRDTVAAMGLMPAAVVDHAKAAAAIETPLRPTTVLFVGNPAAGTPLIQANQTMGVDLPLRFLIWQGEDGATMVGYPDVAGLARRHGIPADGPAVTKVGTGAAAFAKAAAGQP